MISLHTSKESMTGFAPATTSDILVSNKGLGN
jgi:hypothetical protein